MDTLYQSLWDQTLDEWDRDQELRALEGNAWIRRRGRWLTRGVDVEVEFELPTKRMNTR